MHAEAAQAMPVRKLTLHQCLAALFMVAAFALASWLMPHTTWYAHIGKPVFEDVVPKQFGDWVLDETAGASQIVDPQQQNALATVYDQIVSRTYINKVNGRRIMLSLAYGENQSYARQLHRPEACYSSQGLKIDDLHEETLQAAGHALPVNRMTATASGRREQVTYFIRIGDQVISGPSTALNKARTLLGFKGYVADGLLFRVSELAEAPEASNPLQDQFIRDLLHELGPERQTLLIGPNGGASAT